MTNRKQLLDPIGTMCRLIMLNFRLKGTRIGNNNYAITIQVPSSVQWVQRKLNGDDRDNISSLFSAIIKIIEWYINPLYDLKYKNKRTKIISTQLDNPTENLNLVVNEASETIENMYMIVDETEVELYWTCVYKLCNYMCLGLGKLQETYETGNVVYTIQYYINLISEALEGKYTKDKLPKCIINKEITSILDYQKIRELWDYKKVKEICELYDKCFDAQKDTVESEENNKEKIEGYLMAIEHLIDISDGAFRNMMN